MFSRANLEDKAAILSLEQASFPADEAASDESLAMRLTTAPEYFYVYRTEDGEIVGFINGTCVANSDLDHDCMTSHVNGGPVLVIHSVTVKESCRRRRIGTLMLKKYISFMKEIPTLKEIRLLTKVRLVAFYLSCGFHFLGQSSIVHGSVRKRMSILFFQSILTPLIHLFLYTH